MSTGNDDTKSSHITHKQVEAFNQKMRDEYRLKVNVDYAIALKYGEAHLVCSSVFFPDLADGGIEFTTIHTY